MLQRMNRLGILLKQRPYSHICYKYTSILSAQAQHYQENKKNSFLLLHQKNSLVTASLQERHFLSSVKTKLKSFLSDSSKVRFSAVLVYETIGDADYKSFFQCFKLPDSFQSWFLFIQVHMWMTLVVTLNQRHGREFRNILVDSMWNDVELRLEKLGNIRSSERKKYLKELVSQFQGVLIAFDEGILTDDTVLASAAWRTLFACKMVDPELLEKFVLYVRGQIAHLDKLPIDKIMFSGSISFLPLDTVLSDFKE